MATDTWTTERITELKRLYTTNSAAEIAAALGGGLTRCAVIGKARRLGLSLPVKVKAEPKPRAPRVPRTRSGEHHAVFKVIQNGGGGLRLLESKASEMPALRCVEVEPRNLTLQELEPNDCRYIAGDAYLYCAHPAKPGSAYCVPHHALMFIPPGTPARRRQPDFARRSA